MVFSVGIVPIVYAAAKTLVPKEDGIHFYALIAAFVAACLPFQIYYAQEARPYAFFSFSMAVTLWAVIWIMKNPERIRLSAFSTRDYAAGGAMIVLGVGLAFLAWLHNFGVVFAGLIGLFLLGWWCLR